MSEAHAVAPRGEQLRREIGEQPRILATSLERLPGPAAEAAARICRRDARFLVLAGRGSSANAAHYGRYLFEIAAGMPVVIAAPSVVTMYRRPPPWRDATLMAISQSGRSSDIIELVEAARATGTPTIALTNDSDSPLAAAADLTLATPAGTEASVPATKTYTSTLLALAMVAREVAGADTAGLTADDLAHVPRAAECVLTQESRLAAAAQRLVGIRRCAVIARGLNRASASEVALKIQEASYVLAQPFGASDFLHGPVAVVEPGFCVIGLVAAGPAAPAVLETLRRARELGARTLLLGDGPLDSNAVDAATDEAVELGTGTSEPLSPIGLAMAGQLLAHHLALATGIDPERPRGLAKVTVTR